MGMYVYICICIYMARFVRLGLRMRKYGQFRPGWQQEEPSCKNADLITWV